MSEGTIIGMDLGTTNSAVGTVESGFPILFADENGQRIIPSAVYYSPNGDVIVGEEALKRQVAEPERVITSVKRLMGLNLSDVDEAQRTLFPQTLVENSEGGLVLKISEDEFVTPVEASAEILKALKAIAEARLGETIERAVITIPAYFNEAQRLATKKAGELAGLQVERLLAEPTSAALSYGLNKKEDGAKVAVYDLGGGTFDVSILELNSGVFQVLATSGDTQLGGDDFDGSLLEYLVEEVSVAGFSESVIAEKLPLLKEESRRIKEKLSRLEEVKVRVDLLDGEKDFVSIMTRGDFDDRIRGIVERTKTHCRRALTDMGVMQPEEGISTVVLVGGSTRVPAVQEMAEMVFGQAPNLSEHPDESIALGAAIQAGILNGSVRKVVLLDVTPLSLGIETYGGLMNVLIPRNTTIPCKAGEMFTNASAEQTSMRIRVLQGERELAKDNWELGQFDVDFSTGAKAKARVGVQFALDENGMLEVLARDVVTQKDTVVEIQSKAIDVSDENVEKMISESVEYAFEDMDRRIFTEAELKARELLPAVEMALKEAGELLGDEQRAEIQVKAGKVSRLLGVDGIKGSELKSAVEELDKITERLAAIIVEKAMEAALDKQLGS